jgi:DNA-binding NarL/FixJ family response regulator
MRILVADDHEVVRHGLRDLLEDHEGWEVCAEASNGIEAVDLARRIEPEIAVLDVAMPMLDGLEAARRIRLAAPATKVVLYTLHDTEDIAARAREAGARGCVAKSSSASELLSAIELACGPARVPSGWASGAPAGAQHGGAGGRGALTARQRQILQLIADGKGNKEMANVLGISVRTVETHRTNVMRRLRVRSTVQLVRYAVRNHIVDA